MAEHWHRCQRWLRLGVDCPLHAGDQEDEEDQDAEQETGQVHRQVMEVAQPVVTVNPAVAIEQAIMVSQAINAIAEAPGGVGQIGLAGAEPVRTAIPVLAPLEVGQGSTPMTVEPAIPSGGTGFMGMLKPLLLGAFITAVADIGRITKMAPPAAITAIGGSGIRGKAIAAGLIAATQLSELESAFTALMGQRTGRFQDRPEQRAADESAPSSEVFSKNPGTSGGESAPSSEVFQVERPARGFLVDLSQMFTGTGSERSPE